MAFHPFLSESMHTNSIGLYIKMDRGLFESIILGVWASWPTSRHLDRMDNEIIELQRYLVQ